MKKLILSAAVLSVIGLASCEKEASDTFGATDFVTEASADGATVQLSTTDYERVVESELIQPDETGAPTAGIISYLVEGEEAARVNFGEGESDEMTLTDKAGKRRHKKRKKCGHKRKFKKVVIEPIVKTDDCEYPVAGIVQFVDKEGNIKATLDFGDGTCDQFATKTTDEGVYEVDLSERKHKHRK